MSKGLSFDQLFPGKYIKAGEFQGKDVTLTVTNVEREMLSNGTGGEEGAAIVSFKETEKQFVMNKTNGVCFRVLWGDDAGEWIGHRITLHAVKDESGLSESGKCIRVAGSPEMDKPITFKARLGRKMVTQTLKPTARKAPAQAVDEATGEVFADEPTDLNPQADSEPNPQPQASVEGSDFGGSDDVPFDDAGEPPGRGPLRDVSSEPKATAAQLAKVAAALKVSGLYEAEYMALLDSYGAASDADLTQKTAGFVLAALQERML
jgi:hypothetical protein